MTQHASHTSPPVAAQGAGSLLPGATVTDVSSSQTHPAGSCGSAGAFGRVPAYDAVLDFLDAERDRRSGILSLAEILRRGAQEEVANKPRRTRADRQAAFEKGRAAITAAAALRRAARREEIIAALMAEPPPSIMQVCCTLRAKRKNISAIAKEIGRHGLWKPTPKLRAPKQRAPRLRAPKPPGQKRVYPPRPNRIRQKEPKQPEVVLVEIDCMCCRRPFGSWDRKLNRLCRTCTENG